MQNNPQEKQEPNLKDEDLGTCIEAFSAKTQIAGQDGGVATALLARGFELGMFDCALVVRRVEGYNAKVFVAKNADETLTAKGTVYLRVNLTRKLRELAAEGKKNIAIVCTPCEAKAARKIIQTLSGVKVTIIGLFCFEAFNRDKLKTEFQARLGVDLDKGEKTQIRHGKFTVTVEGKEYSCKVKDLDGAAEKICSFCTDFTSLQADISVGSTGSKQGFSTVLVRSAVGKELVDKLDVTKEPVELLEIQRLASFKRQRAQKNLQAAKKGQVTLDAKDFLTQTALPFKTR